SLFAKLIYYFSSHVDSDTLEEEFKREEFLKYFIYISLYMNFFNVSIIEKYSINLKPDTLAMLKKDTFTKSHFYTFIQKTTGLFNMFSTYLEDIIKDDLKFIEENNFNFVIIQNSNTEVKNNFIYEIIYWFEKSIFNYFCKSEFHKIKQRIPFIKANKAKVIYSLFVSLHYYGIKILLDNNLTETIFKSSEAHIYYKENEKFAKELLYFKFMLRIIMVNYIRISLDLATYYKTTNFFIFLRIFFNNNIILIPDLDIWLMNTIFDNDKIKLFQRQDLIFTGKKDYQTLDEEQKRIFIALFIKSKLSNRNYGEYEPIINSIENYALKE
ncbi:hypothetical protein H311_03502, partial [Anncaliia algerae PRA109]